MRRLACYAACLHMFALSAVAGWPADFAPNWVPGDSWTVTVSFLETRALPGVEQLMPTNGPRPTYPYTEFLEYSTQQVVYAYEVTSVGTAYEFKGVLFDPFVSRPGHPNVESNRTQVAVINIVVSTNAPSECKDWMLMFDTNTLALLEIQGKAEHGEMAVNPFGQDAWLTRFFGNKRIIHDFPALPSGGTDETRILSRIGGGDEVTQSVVFAGDTATITLSRHNRNYKMQQKATFEWIKGKKWWTTAKVELGTNVVISASLVEE